MAALITIEQYSHGARLSGFSRELYDKLSHFLNRLALKEPRKLPHGGMVMELKKVFFGLTHDHKEIFIHRNHMPDLMAFLYDRGISESQINRVQIPIPESVPAQFKIFSKIKPYDYQVPIIEKLSDGFYSRRLYLQTGKERAWVR